MPQASILVYGLHILVQGIKHLKQYVFDGQYALSLAEGWGLLSTDGAVSGAVNVGAEGAWDPLS